MNGLPDARHVRIWCVFSVAAAAGAHSTLEQIVRTSVIAITSRFVWARTHVNDNYDIDSLDDVKRYELEFLCYWLGWGRLTYASDKILHDPARRSIVWKFDFFFGSSWILSVNVELVPCKCCVCSCRSIHFRKNTENVIGRRVISRRINLLHFYFYTFFRCIVFTFNIVFFRSANWSRISSLNCRRIWIALLGSHYLAAVWSTVIWPRQTRSTMARRKCPQWCSSCCFETKVTQCHMSWISSINWIIRKTAFHFGEFLAANHVQFNWIHRLILCNVDELQDSVRSQRRQHTECADQLDGIVGQWLSQR